MKNTKGVISKKKVSIFLFHPPQMHYSLKIPHEKQVLTVSHACTPYRNSKSSDKNEHVKNRGLWENSIINDGVKLRPFVHITIL